MLLANKKADKTLLDILNFVVFNPLANNNPIEVLCRKLIAKLNEQIQLAAEKDYTPMQHKWLISIDGKINLVVRYGSKPLEFAKGKNAIELASEV